MIWRSGYLTTEVVIEARPGVMATAAIGSFDRRKGKFWKCDDAVVRAQLDSETKCCDSVWARRRAGPGMTDYIGIAVDEMGYPVIRHTQVEIAPSSGIGVD